MAVVKEVQIDGRPVRFMASARTPRLYRNKFGRDIIVDMTNLSKKYEEVKDTDAQVSFMDLTMFENLAYIMNKQADPEAPDSIDEWLDNFDTFDVYTVLPVLMELWGLNKAGIANSKKK